MSLKDCGLYKLSLSSEILQSNIVLKNKQKSALNRWREVETGSGVSSGEGKPFPKARKELPPSDKVQWLILVEGNDVFTNVCPEVYSIMPYSLYNQPGWTVTHKMSDVWGSFQVCIFSDVLLPLYPSPSPSWSLSALIARNIYFSYAGHYVTGNKYTII